MKSLQKFLLNFRPWEILLIGAMLVCSLLLALLLRIDQEPLVWHEAVYYLALSLAFTFFGWIFAYSKYTDFVPRTSMLITPEGKITFCPNSDGYGTHARWSWDPIFRGVAITSFKSEKRKFSRKQDIMTENPKVRHFACDLNISFNGSPYKAKALIQNFGNVQTAVRYVDSCLYEFMDKQSKQFANLNNPLDPKQQEHFAGLVDQHLRPQFKGKGITLSKSTFNDALNPAQI